jgi:KEOPS complex subunit Pcc1
LRKAVFTFELGTPQNRAVLAALGPEASRDVPRATAKVSTQGPVLKLEITAEDSASLRAAVNSYLRWVKLASGAAQAGSEAREKGAAVKKGPDDPKTTKTRKNVA